MLGEVVFDADMDMHGGAMEPTAAAIRQRRRLGDVAQAEEAAGRDHA